MTNQFVFVMVRDCILCEADTKSECETRLTVFLTGLKYIFHSSSFTLWWCLLFNELFWFNFNLNKFEGLKNPEEAGQYEEWLQQRHVTSSLKCQFTVLYIGHKHETPGQFKYTSVWAIIKQHPNDGERYQYVGHKS